MNYIRNYAISELIDFVDANLFLVGKKTSLPNGR